jgi:hypothetical protein
MGVMEEGTFGINCDLIPSSLYKIKEPNLKKQILIWDCSFLKPSRVLNLGCIQNKGHSISVTSCTDGVVYSLVCV